MANKNPKIEQIEKTKFDKLPKEEHAQIARKGAEASNKVQAEKKLFKEALLCALNAKDEAGEFGLTKIVAGIFKEAEKGNPKAFEVIRDTIGEKPKEEVIQTNRNIVVATQEDKDLLDSI